MSEIELLDLPDHILVKILSYIPDHFVVASVCQKFYELDCLVYDGKLEMSVSYFDKTKIQEMISSKRIFHSMDVSFGFQTEERLILIKQLFQRHGSAVKNLRLLMYKKEEGPELTEDDLIEILNYFPILENLDVEGTDVNDGDDSNKVSAKPLLLLKLKVLTIYETSAKFFTKHLPENLETLNVKLVLFSFFVKDYNALEKTLKKLQSKSPIEVRLHVYIQIGIETPAVRNFLRSQPNLKSLEILSPSHYRETDDEYSNLNFAEYEDFLDGIGDLQHLEHLRTDYMSPTIVRKLPSMKNLKILDLWPKVYDDSDPEDYIYEFSLLKSAQLEELTIKTYSDESLLQIAKNFPIKSLTIVGTKNTMNFFLQNFPLLEDFGVSFPYGRDSNFYLSDGQTYPNLKSLTIYGPSNLIKLMDSLKALPNLKKISLLSVFDYSNDLFEKLKQNLGKISDIDLEIYFRYCKPGILCKESIEALRDLSNDERLDNFYCSFETFNKVNIKKIKDKLQGYFRMFEHYSFLSIAKGKSRKSNKLSNNL